MLHFLGRGDQRSRSYRFKRNIACQKKLIIKCLGFTKRFAKFTAKIVRTTKIFV